MALKQMDLRIGDLLTRYGITELCALSYDEDSFRHVRKKFVGSVALQWTDQERDAVSLDLTRHMAEWLEQQDLTLYSKVSISRCMSFMIENDRTEIIVQIDLYGTADDHLFIREG